MPTRSKYDPAKDPERPLERFVMRRHKRNHWERLSRLYGAAGGLGIPSEVRFDALGITIWSPGKLGITIPWGAVRECIDGHYRFVR